MNGDEPILELDQIQGNVIPGFKKNHQHFAFFTITDVNAARTWIESVASRVASARQVLIAHALWKDLRAQRGGAEPGDAQWIFLNLAFTAVGLRKLVAPADVDKFDDHAFRDGLTEDRSALLGDPQEAGDPGAPKNWLVGGSAAALVDMVLISASDDYDWLKLEESQLISDAEGHGMKLIHQDEGKVRPGDMAGHEPFGFKDGISEPAARGKWPDGVRFVYDRTLPPGTEFDPLRKVFAGPGQPLVWPGSFIFGYPRQPRDGNVPSSPPVGPAWARNGSYVVYRRLRQDVPAFAKFLEDSAAELAKTHPAAGLTAERVGAMLVGRWKSGTPIERSPLTDLGIEGNGATYFTFSEATTIPLPGDSAPLNGADPDGKVCPFGAHIRKVNPRDDTTDLGSKQRTLPRLILRRGIPFDETDKTSGDQGLIFVAYQSSIVDQFEFLMTNWVNQPDRPKSDGGFDPLLASGGSRSIRLQLEGVAEPLALPLRFVRPTGGAYFFAPSIGFLMGLNAS